MKNILLADDDKDDSLLFGEVLSELDISIQFETVINGELLMHLLNRENYQLPDILFLDLNLPLKNGLTCLTEVKAAENLKHLLIVIFSTSYEPSAMKVLYDNGANYYIRKPNNFQQLKDLIRQAIILTAQTPIVRQTFESFVLTK